MRKKKITNVDRYYVKVLATKDGWYVFTRLGDQESATTAPSFDGVKTEEDLRKAVKEVQDWVSNEIHLRTDRKERQQRGNEVLLEVLSCA